MCCTIRAFSECTASLRLTSASEQFVRDVEALAEMVDVPATLAFQVQHDPDDDPIVAAAVFGRIHVLVTRDRHLLRQEVVDYCAQFGIRALTDAELLVELRAQDAQSP